MELNVSKKPDEHGEEDLFRLFDPEGIEFWNFLKLHKDRITNMVNAYNTDAPWRPREDKVLQADTLSNQQQPIVTLANQQPSTTDKDDVKRLRLFVKDYFAEFFLASMSIAGMILAVLYMLAHTWR